MKTLKAQLFSSVGAELGEGAQLFPDSFFRFVDIPNGKIFRLAHGAVILEKKFEHEVSKSLPWFDGQVVLGRNFIHLIDSSGDEVSAFQVSDLNSNLRCSDGCVLPDGSLLVGLVDRDLAEGQGSLIRITQNLEVEVVVRSATIPNGIAVMPDGKSVVWVDSPTQTLKLFPLLEDGGVGEARDYFRIDPALGVPDGLCVDSAGGVWVAMWNGGKVIRVGPKASLDAIVEVGCLNVTSCAFDQLGNLLITTATAALPEDQQKLPGAGGIWMIEQKQHGVMGLETLVAKVRHS